MHLLHPHLRATLESMLDELESSALVVGVFPASDPRFEGHGVRGVVSRNAAWYRRFCASFPSSRRDQNRKGRTLIKRRETVRAIGHLLGADPSRCPTYSHRLLDAARLYYRKHRADILARAEDSKAA